MSRDTTVLSFWNLLAVPQYVCILSSRRCDGFLFQQGKLRLLLHLSTLSVLYIMEAQISILSVSLEL